MRIGFGYDAHRLKEGRRCVLCGVEIPSSFGPDGHSDADAPVHALIDALLGALALGDIGKHFPDSDIKWRDADSIGLLREAYSLVLGQGYVLGNADITIILEAPRLSPYIEQMRACVAETLGTDVSNISVKATTEEKMGFTGNSTGVASTAAVLLQRCSTREK
jgi:2-C-methyl-D-erythritol 2,4-cyclodiphosphate synthase